MLAIIGHNIIVFVILKQGLYFILFSFMIDIV